MRNRFLVAVLLILSLSSVAKEQPLAAILVYDGPAGGLEKPKLIDIYGPEFEDVFWEGAPK